MAKYDRRILLPYLRNIYTMELLTQQQKQQRTALLSHIQELEEALKQDTPPKRKAPPSPVASILLGVLSALFLFSTFMMGYLSQSRQDFQNLWNASGLAFLLFLLLFLFSQMNYRKKNLAFQQYCKKAEKYVQRASRREKVSHDLENFKAELRDLSRKMDESTFLLHNLCNLNVIPVQFRTLSAFGFLFDYFLSSKANDVDVVIQSYAVEHLKENEAHPDAQAIRVLLHQRAKIADNITADPVQRQYYTSQLQQIIDAEPNPDLRNQYQKMIHVDLNVSAYFSKNEHLHL